MEYRGKLILAPMVRVSTLPARLLALEYGADIVYCEEIIDFKLLQCQRVENKLLGTVDFVWEDGTVVFRTCEAEKGRCVLQLGTADPARALAASKLVERDVAAVDVNMGCPKSYSTKGGMGAALLSKPDTIREILTTLVGGLSIPVTCKIRILPESHQSRTSACHQLEDTLSLCRMIASTGVAALAVHGRLRQERPRHSNHDDVIAAIAREIDIPIIANGGSNKIKCRADMEAFAASCGVNSVMVARAAEWNPSVFRAGGPLPVLEVVKRYLRIAMRYDNSFINTKYVVGQMVLHKEGAGPHAAPLHASKTTAHLCAIWGMEGELAEVEEARERSGRAKRPRLEDECGGEADDGVIVMDVQFIRHEYGTTSTPKQELELYSRRHGLDRPSYQMTQRASDKYFKCVLHFDGQRYTNVAWDRVKRFAEQSAALVLAKTLGFEDKRIALPRWGGAAKLRDGGDAKDSSAEGSQMREDKKGESGKAGGAGVEVGNPSVGDIDVEANGSVKDSIEFASGQS